MKNDDFGDRMKMYEGCSANVLMPRLPIVIRLDGNNFSKFTKGLKRPYDERLSDLMVSTAKFLAEETNAVVAYTQSDEITLVLYSNDIKSQTYFNGRQSKINSILAAKCSVFFNRSLPLYLPEKPGMSPVFDCRCWVVPSQIEAINALLWREKDATKNSISMAAQSYYSHNELMGKNSSEKQDMLHEKGINWNDYPAFFKRGTFIHRIKVERPFTTEEIEKLPEKHEARLNPELTVLRNLYSTVCMPPLSKVSNKVDFIFNGEGIKFYE